MALPPEADLPIVSAIRTRLKNDLPATLLYHNSEHTDEVIKEVVFLAKEDGLSPKEIELLVIAAAYHDAGFLLSERENERFGADLAEEALAKQCYSISDQRYVRAMILDTILQFPDAAPRQIATTPLSRYLLDADMGNLGRPDFLDKTECVRKELKLPANRSFYNKVYQLIAAHRWNTPAAERLRSEEKERNVVRLEEKISGLS